VRELKSAWIVGLVVAGIAAVVLLLRTSEELEPEILDAFVAIEPDSLGRATTGTVEIRAGTPFRLHAVVRARDWRGRQFYYTEAEALDLASGPVPGDQLRPWDRSRKVRVLWFTVEAGPPYTEVDTLDAFERVVFREIFQPDWPQAWTIPGSVVPAVENFLPGREERRIESRFGIQRYHVRIEILEPGGGLLAAERLRSAGVVDLEADPSAFPTVIAALDWPRSSLSRVFGLPQTEPVADPSPEIVDELSRRMHLRLSFDRVQLLRGWLRETGLAWDELAWEPVEINGEAEWAPWASLRAGTKIAFAYDDRGVEGRLDGEDLCFDFDRGATVRALEEIFVGEGLVERAVIGPDVPGDSRGRQSARSELGGGVAESREDSLFGQ
jgi:hypothetical protein